MNLILAMALRNARRSWRRSLLTAIAITFGTALLQIGLAWVDGVLGDAFDRASAMAGHVRVVTPAFAEKENMFPLSENMPQTDPLVKAVASVAGIKGAYARIQLPTSVSVDASIGDVFALLQGAPTDYYTEVLELDSHLAEGRMLAADSEVMIGKTLAEEAHIKLDEQMIFIGQTQDGSPSGLKVKVVGIVDLGSKAQNKQAYITLEKARYVADMDGGATEILAFGADREQAEALSAKVGALPELKGLEVRAWSQRRPWSEVKKIIGPISSILVTVIVMITALVVLNTMLMSVLERTSEIGVLRAMGMRRAQTILLFVAEAIGIAILGGLLGALIGACGALYLQHVGVNIGAGADRMPSSVPINTIVYGRFKFSNMLNGMFLAMLMAVIGSALPAWRAASIEPVEAMRHRR